MEEQYTWEEESIMDNRIMNQLRETGHQLHHLSEGRASQKKILILLSKSGPLTQRELTERLRVQPASSSEILTKMEQSEWILRSPSEEDRRTMDVSLTEMGKQAAAEAEKQGREVRRDMLSCLSREEKEALLPILEKLNQSWRNRSRARPESHRPHFHPEKEGKE